MRRGLIAWSKTELPEAALAARVERLRAAMREAGLDAFLVYTNNTRPAGASFLSGFVPYWSEAMLVVPREGKPVLVAALSKRVRSWMESTCRVAEVISAPRLGQGAGKLIAQRGGGAVGVVELDFMQAGIVDDLRAEGVTVWPTRRRFSRGCAPRPIRPSWRSPPAPAPLPIAGWPRPRKLRAMTSPPR